MKRGQFISIEGGEGAGKSTQIAQMVAFLQARGISVVQTREPGGTLLGEQIRALVLEPRERGMAAETELLLMFAARVEHLQQVIVPALDAGQWVISDRFLDASYAYQGAGRGLNQTRIDLLADHFVGEYRPDLTVLFDVPVAVGMARVQANRQKLDRIEQEHMAFFEVIRQAYLQRARGEPNRFRVIHAEQSLESVSEQVLAVMQAFYQQYAPH